MPISSGRGFEAVRVRSRRSLLCAAGRELCCLLAGVGALAVADGAYAYLAEVERYANGNVLDTEWVAGFLAIAVGAPIEHPSEAWRRAAVDPPTSPSLVAPLLPMLLARIVTALEMHAGRALDGPALTMALAVDRVTQAALGAALARSDGARVSSLESGR